MADSSRTKTLTNDPGDRNIRVMSPTSVFRKHFIYQCHFVNFDFLANEQFTVLVPTAKDNYLFHLDNNKPDPNLSSLLQIERVLLSAAGTSDSVDKPKEKASDQKVRSMYLCVLSFSLYDT